MSAATDSLVLQHPIIAALPFINPIYMIAYMKIMLENPGMSHREAVEKAYDEALNRALTYAGLIAPGASVNPEEIVKRDLMQIADVWREMGPFEAAGTLISLSPLRPEVFVASKEAVDRIPASLERDAKLLALEAMEVKKQWVETFAQPPPLPRLPLLPPLPPLPHLRGR